METIHEGVAEPHYKNILEPMLTMMVSKGNGEENLPRQKRIII